MNTYRHRFIFLLFTALGGCGADDAPFDIETSAETQQSIISTVVSASFSMNGSTTNIQTGEMPANWFSSEVDTTPIYVYWHIPPSACRISASGTFSSYDTGNLNAVSELDGSIGYSWSAQHMVANVENHWHNEIDCNGNTTLSGCQAPRTASYALIVGGACLGSNAPSCWANGSVSLPAIQDPDVVNDSCLAQCKQSLSSCALKCAATCSQSNNLCRRCCECACMDEIHSANPACSEPQASCYFSKGSRPACIPMPALPDILGLRDLYLP